MARSISVKVSTAKVIKALETKLSDSAKAIASNEKKRKDYEKVEKAWAKEVADLAIKNISKAEVRANENWRGDISVDFNLPAKTFTLPAKPELELERELAPRPRRSPPSGGPRRGPRTAATPTPRAASGARDPGTSS